MGRTALPKCLSLGDSATLRVDRHLHDYRHHGNREFVLDSGTRTVKLWASWYDLQAHARPSSRQESWLALDGAPGDLPAEAPFSSEPALRNLDRQIAAANADGVSVILALDECSPPWAVGRDLVVPRGLGRYRHREEGARPPLDCSPDGPWAWFVEHLCARYQQDAPRNPDGAHIAALEICHEPNMRWPQERAHVAVAEMMRTAAQIAWRWGGPAILAPSLSDLGANVRMFARQLLKELRDWSPPSYVGWSQHNYGDLRRGEVTGVIEVLQLLSDYGWHDAARAVWLTEGAIPTADPAACSVSEAFEHERFQAELLRINHELLCDIDHVRLWTYHTIHDLAGNRLKTGLRQDFDWERQHGGPEKMACDRFVDLPGDEALALPRGASATLASAA